MSIIIRDVEAGDLERVRELNAGAVPAVNDVPLEWLGEYQAKAHYFRVAENGSSVAGFLIAMGPGLDYGSLNYLWFREKYEKFLYIDRVVVDPGARRFGLGTALYGDLMEFAGTMAPRVTCEVNLKPLNAGSFAFHERFGFEQVGTQDTEGGKKTVALLRKRLG